MQAQRWTERKEGRRKGEKDGGKEGKKREENEVRGRKWGGREWKEMVRRNKRKNEGKTGTRRRRVPAHIFDL